jgi:hypothetical protein
MATPKPNDPLVAYQARNGRPAESVQALVPDYLPALPADPFGDGPFQYRVSAGEHIRLRPDGDDSPSFDAAAGQGVVWSVGPDLQNGGGTTQSQYIWPQPGWKPGGDLVYLVPVVGRR